MAAKHFPEESVSGRSTPSDMNEHLRPTWCTLRNSVANDQQGVLSSLNQIKNLKKNIRFLQERVVVSLNALDAIEGVR